MDASWVEGLMSTCGWILRDEAGVVKWFGAKTYPPLQTSLDAEANAPLWAMFVL